MSSKTNNQFRPTLDTLGERTLLSVTVSTVTGAGELTITGSQVADQIFVRQAANGTVSVYDGFAPAGSLGSAQRPIERTGVSKINIFARGGNDSVSVDQTTIRCAIDGGAGNDTLTGGLGVNVITGGTRDATSAVAAERLTGGNDKITGGLVNDTLDGGDGNDTIYGSNGNDLIRGGDGDDFLRGGDHNDTLFGGSGTDRLFGEAGDDFLDAGSKLEAIDLRESGTDWNPWQTAVGGTAAADVAQAGRPSCSFLASLASAATRNASLDQNITYVGDSNFDVRMFKAGTGWVNVRVRFDGTVDKVNDPTAQAEGESWVVIYQRAYEQMRGSTAATWPYEAMTALTGRTSTRYEGGVFDNDFATIATALSSGKLVVTATKPNAASVTAGMVANHSYAITGVTRNAAGQPVSVTVRNPWGVDSVSRTAIEGANDGVFTISWANFKTNMQGFWVN